MIAWKPAAYNVCMLVRTSVHVYRMGGQQISYMSLTEQDTPMHAVHAALSGTLLCSQMHHYELLKRNVSTADNPLHELVYSNVIEYSGTLPETRFVH